MTIDEYKDLLLEDEINIGYDVEEDDLPDQYDDESYIDGLLTTGFHACLLYTSPSPRDA